MVIFPISIGIPIIYLFVKKYRDNNVATKALIKNRKTRKNEILRHYVFLFVSWCLSGKKLRSEVYI